MKTDVNDPILKLFQALSDPTRLDIFRCLMTTPEKRVQGDTYQISKSTMSHHIKLLKEAGLITVRKDGTAHVYSVDQAMLARYPAFFSLFTEELKGAKLSDK
ncbi:ArsR/SmtB family transcription factor [Listeria ilorinensis]|uniref:ArsR/SmtB family transcription factor n=1 Tax=Listeria ilorinensis TaxID=2867439 RepID=UPI001EF5930D|nr:metalloregulator ArsR/SmtB family transcription factor [Listeria ilorinensis]